MTEQRGEPGVRRQLTGLARLLGLELRPRGVNAKIVAPGTIRAGNVVWKLPA